MLLNSRKPIRPAPVHPVGSRTRRSLATLLVGLVAVVLTAPSASLAALPSSPPPPSTSPPAPPAPPSTMRGPKGELFSRATTPGRVQTRVVTSGFQDSLALTGIDHPTAVAFAPTGEIFVAEKRGTIVRFDSLSDTTPTRVADLRTNVYNYWDRGLLGLAIDPGYPARPYLYALYTYDAEIGGTAPKWGTTPPKDDDNCPNPPKSTGDGCLTSGRLSRLTLTGGVVSQPEAVLVNDWCGQFPSHAIGTVAFGPDGFLYAGGGDGASFSGGGDYGQNGGTLPDTTNPITPRNPCGDPPGGVGGAMSPPTAEGGSLRAQDKLTTSDPTNLDGTLIRVDPNTGLAAPTNASYQTGADANDKRIIAFGLRNPFRFTFRPGSTEVWIGDVGSSYYEELDRLVDPNAQPTNFGWPCYEANGRQSAFNGLHLDMCESLYAAGPGAARGPYFSYRHTDPVDGCAEVGGSSITGVAFYSGGSYPASYNGALFLADFSRNCIWVMPQGTNGLPDPSQVRTFISSAGGGPVQLVAGPGGDIFYADLDGASIHRISYVGGGNNAPIVVATADQTTGPAPLVVNFDASGSSDPDPGDSIRFAWDLNGDGVYDDSTDPKPQWTYPKGTYDVAVRVTDDHLASTTKRFTISAGNDPPVAVIDSPVASKIWVAGERVAFGGHATDPQQGTLPATSLAWTLILHHCPSDCHEHMITGFTGVDRGTFDAPDHEYPSYLELRLTATDQGGLTSTTSVMLQPKTVDLTFASDPAGLQLSGGDASGTAAFSRRVIVGSRQLLDAPSPQALGGSTYSFGSWSDGGGRNHSISAPATARTYTATFTRPPSGDAPDTCGAATVSSPVGTWWSDTIGSATDVDWYRFTTGMTGYIRLMLGSLPKDYDVSLYSSCSALVTSSTHSGLTYEEIYQKATAGSYYVRVTGRNGAFSPAPYALRFESLPESLLVISSSSWVDKTGQLRIAGEVLDNTSSRYQLVNVSISLRDAADVEIGTTRTFTSLDVLKGRARSPFLAITTRPPGYHHYRLTVSGEVTTQGPVQNLSWIRRSTTITGGVLIATGQIKNNNAFAVDWAELLTTIYDARGAVIDTRQDWFSPTHIVAGGTATFEARFPRITGLNRVSYLTQASQSP